MFTWYMGRLIDLRRQFQLHVRYFSLDYVYQCTIIFWCLFSFCNDSLCLFGTTHSKIPAMGGFAWNGLPSRAFVCILFGSNFAFVSVSQPKQFCLISKKNCLLSFFLDFFNVYLFVADTRWSYSICVFILSDEVTHFVCLFFLINGLFLKWPKWA